MTRARFLLLSFAVTVFTTVLALAGYYTLVGPSVKTTEASRAQVREAINRHIEGASQRSQDAITKRSHEFRKFVDERKVGAKAFARDAASFYGKWRALKSKLPFTDSDGHRRYIIELFDKHIFAPELLSGRVKDIVENAARDLDQEQNNLAVAIRQEILGRHLVAGEIPVAREELTKAIDRAADAAQLGALKGATGLVVAEVTSTVTSQVLVRMGISTGLLSAGAATSWWTLGAGTAIAFAISAIWDWIDDPAGDIQRELETSLDRLGQKGSDAIREEMSKVVNERRAHWLKAAEEMH